MINTLVFDSQLLPDGHLTCPPEFLHEKNIQFKVLVIVNQTTIEATDHDIERSAARDLSEDVLTDEEIQYYMNLENA